MKPAVFVSTIFAVYSSLPCGYSSYEPKRILPKLKRINHKYCKVRVIPRRIELRHIKKPWGSFDEYALNERSTVKILTVNPGARTSLQSHRHRKEFWVALDKGIRVQIGKEKIMLRRGSNILAKRGAKHRLQCEGRLAARILEISIGEFSENDIVRYEDDYGRVTARVSRKR